METEKRKLAEAELAKATASLDLVEATQDKVTAKKLHAAAKATKQGNGGSATAIIVATDWHLGELVEPDQVDGLNEFNMAVAESRLTRLWNRACYMIDFARNISRINEIAILFLGDIISGVIHDDLEQTNEIPASEQIIAAQNAMASGLKEVHCNYPKMPIRVMCSSGNHGRMSSDKYVKAEYSHSLEYIAFRNLAQQFGKEPWATFQVAKGYFNKAEFQGRMIRAHHGHAIRYQQGVLGPAVPVGKKIAAWNFGQRPAYLDIFGHLHTRFPHPRFNMTGCLVGYSEFAIRCGIPYEPPSQEFIVIDREWGKVLSMALHLEEKPSFPDAY